MGEVGLYSALLNFFSVERIRKFVIDFTDVYLKPKKAWKKAINQQKSSFEYFLKYFSFYLILLFLLVWDIKTVFEHTLIGLILLLIPVLFYGIPFVFLTKKWNKRIKLNRLFRLFFLFKLQLLPLNQFMGFVAQKADIESPYFFVYNSLFLVDLLFILVIPLILKLKLSQRIIWISLNWLFGFFQAATFVLLAINSKDYAKIFDKIERGSPRNEMILFSESYRRSDFYLVNNYIWLFIDLDGKLDNGYAKIIDIQYDTLFLMDYLKPKIEWDYIKTIYMSFNDLPESNLLNGILHKDQLNKMGFDLRYGLFRDVNNKNSFYNNSIANSSLVIPREKIDSLKKAFNITFYNDLKLTDSIRKKSKYKLLQNNAELIYKYLNQKETLSSNADFVKSISILNVDLQIDLSDGTRMYRYKIPNEYRTMTVEPIIQSNNEISSRFKTYESARKLLFYPLFVLIDYYYPVEDIQDQFKTIIFEERLDGETDYENQGNLDFNIYYDPFKFQ